jgi:uncharacterized Zn-binding protein involved in type VI secretion
MPTANDYFALSDAVYAGPGSDKAAPGWTKVAESPVAAGNAGSPNGYFGAAYRNDATGEIVVANRGSRPSVEGLQQDWAGSDVQIGLQGRDGVPKAFEDAQTFATSVQNQFPGQPISFTGHSLGGAEAQVQAATTGGMATTFGAPGVAFAVDSSAAAAAKNRVVNYVLPGDAIGMSGTHIGKVALALPSGGTLLKDAVAVAVGTAVGGPLGALVAVLGLIFSNHPLGNYAAAAASSPSGGGGRPAARITDMHACPMVSPGPVPHVGGPILPACSPNVVTGSLFQARVTDHCQCVGPVDTIVQGSSTVYVNGLPAARIGDLCAHGGCITSGFPTVLIGG